MEKPDFIFVTGCNAAGKSSLIRSHLSEFPGYEVIMTDVYKGRSREVFKNTIQETKHIILETPFNDEGFRDLIDLARNAGYQMDKNDFDIIAINSDYLTDVQSISSRKTFNT